MLHAGSLGSSPVRRLKEARKPSTARSDHPPRRGTNRSGPNPCSGNMRGLIRRLGLFGEARRDAKVLDAYLAEQDPQHAT